MKYIFFDIDGTLKAGGYDNEYIIARMHGEEAIEYVHPKAEPILKETYGIIVYQEQVMQLTRALAGFTRGNFPQRPRP